MGFAENLKDARLRAGLTQQEVADALGVTKAAVCTWESGTSKPRMGKMTEIAEVLGTSVPELMGETAVSDLPWDELELLKRYRACSPANRIRLLNDAQSYAEENESTEEA